MLAFYTSIMKEDKCGSILLITNLVCNIPGHVFFFFVLFPKLSKSYYVKKHF